MDKRLLKRMRNLIRLGKLQKVLIGLVVLLFIGVASVYLFRDALRGWVNGIRAERITERAEAAFEKEQWGEAARLGQAAYYLAPEDKDIQMLLARALLKERDASAISWWRMLLMEPELPVEELRQVTAAVMAWDDPAEALPFLNRLVELDADSPETRRLWLQSLQRLGRYGTARDLASRFAEAGTEDWGIHRSYLAFQREEEDKSAPQRVVEHLASLLEEENALALNAARELLLIETADQRLREQAAALLEAKSENDLDRLYARSLKVKEGDGQMADLGPLLESILSQPEEELLDDLLPWSRWMHQEDWFLKNVDWKAYRNSGGMPDPYFQLLLTQGETERVLQMTEDLSSETGSAAVAFLYYRSLAQEAVGEPERARQTRELLVETVEPDSGRILERYLIRGSHWELLEQLYQRLTAENPENKILLLRRIAALYYSGNQGALAALLHDIERGDFITQPDLEGFLCYLELVIDGYSSELHQHLEKLMGRYPEIFDFRLLLGVSYALQGQISVARSFAENMPEMGIAAPRYLRVSAIILGKRAEDLLGPGERETLLPREQYLLSQSKPESIP